MKENVKKISEFDVLFLRKGDMEKYKEIDLKTWPRAEIFTLYTKQWPGVVHMGTKRLNVEKTIAYLKKNGLKTVPSLLYIATECINAQGNYKIAYKDGKLVEWEEVHPLYPVLNANYNITYHTIDRERSFAAFYKNYLKDMEENKAKTGAFATVWPENSFVVTVPHFFEFDSVSMPYRGSNYYFAPIVVLGKYKEEDGHLKMPVAITGNHAVADAWHTNKFYEDMQNMLDNPETWCII